MNILCFADTRFPIERANGLQTMATCHALASRGHDVTLVVRPDAVDPPRDPFDYYDVPPLPQLTIDRIDAVGGTRSRRVQFLLAAASRLLRARPDVVFTRDLGLAAFLLQIPGRRRPRVIYESHGIAPVVSEEMATLLGNADLRPTRQKLARLERRERRVWRHASAYVTITQALADELTTRYGSRRHVFMIPDGVKLEPLNPRTPEPQNPRTTPVAGYAGHLYPWKGVDVFLQALALAPDIHGLIVGGHPSEPDLARVTSLISTLKLDARVVVTGMVRPGDVRDRLAPATMLVLPNTRSAISERYTSPLKLFEYLAMRRPVVASDLPAIREVLAHEQTALLVPPGDARALADAMVRLARDHALAADIASASAALAPRYSWDARAERLEAALAAARAAA